MRNYTLTELFPTVHYQNKRSIDKHTILNQDEDLPQILMVTSFPPRECGIATYSQDLKNSLDKQFGNSFDIKICALENLNEIHSYSQDVKYILNTDYSETFKLLAKEINCNNKIEMVLIQHEFGFFNKTENNFIEFLNVIIKPIIIVFHTVLPRPSRELKENVQNICMRVSSIIVMTKISASILMNEYEIDENLITVINHGTHLVKSNDREALKTRYRLQGRKICTTFGLMGPGKSIETSLLALPEIIKQHPSVLFLIIGKTHPSLVKMDGETYRKSLEKIVDEFDLSRNVIFINKFLPLNELLDYLHLTDVYLFTSKDPNQAVSGTFSYALSCGCPVISTPIPHALEVLDKSLGIIVDFGDAHQISIEVNKLLNDEDERLNISSKGLHKMAATCWENSAIHHAAKIEALSENKIKIKFSFPESNLSQINRLTTEVGMIQFSLLDTPDLDTGYTLDDNARALIAMIQFYEIKQENEVLIKIKLYLNFIRKCLQNDNYFLNYVDKNLDFTSQNEETNLEDSNGRAIWALGYLLSQSNILPDEYCEEAKDMFVRAISRAHLVHSTRAMAFIIKGIYYSNVNSISTENNELMIELADRLVQMYRHESNEDWQWFESYLTYANGVLPESLLCAWLTTGHVVYRDIAKSSFDFLLSKTIKNNRINVVSNKNWETNKRDAIKNYCGGEQAIDVTYTILALSKFYFVFNRDKYKRFMEFSFSWFLGNNHLGQIMYNPCTGGCYDGLEEFNVNLNQGAESTISYLMARLEMEKISEYNFKIFASSSALTIS
jgi:glycosyltransferase involved in cell wall biosynthesis